ncbi:MAG: fatty acid desaturase [Longimicrobiales bacterium]
MKPKTPKRARVAHFNEMLAPYQGPDNRRAILQLAVTATGFFGLWYLMLRSLDLHYGLTLLLAVPTAGFLVRLFMIQHDCGHGSFFKSRKAASFVGHCIGVLTLLPYDYWRRTHALHHAHSGDLEARGFGDVETLTVNEYLERSPKGRLAYRVYRNPLVLFCFGALFHFVIKQRYPWNLDRSWKQAWRSVWLTNLGLVLCAGLLSYLIGWQRLLMIQGPIILITCSVGVWLFYVQHQFEDTYWETKPEWDYYDAALKGSSHLVLPAPLQWITACIGLHHVHHMSPRIPNYRLTECLEANPELQTATKVTMRGSWELTRLHLWDEDAGRLIGFGEVEARA